MTWMAVAIGGSAVVGAGASMYGANAAADAQAAAGKKGLAEQRRQYNIGMQMFEPQRMLGYQALADIASMYGYATPGYQPANQLLAMGGGGSINVKGGGGGGSGLSLSPLAAFGVKDPIGGAIGDALGMGGKANYGASINPLAGTVDVQGAGAKKDALYTNYLQTGVWEGGKGGRGAKIRSAIDNLRGQGYSYADGQGQFPGQIAPTPAGQPGNMSRFFTSPDYTFRRDEGQRDIGNSFAARGGAASGNALRALSEFNQNLASSEFGNYMNRLFGMAGMGQTATNNAVSAGHNFGNNYAQGQQNIGDARASGIVSGINGVTNSLNTGMSNYLLSKYFSGPQAPPAMTTNYGPWAGGYRFGP